MTGEALKTWMAASGVTQAAFAARLGVSQGVVSMWASGRSIPSRQNIAAIAAATDGAVPPSSWFDLGDAA